jgi:hypothetical protein
MGHRHLSEEELVEFLYDDFESGAASIERKEHLRACDLCQGELIRLKEIANLLSRDVDCPVPEVARRQVASHSLAESSPATAQNKRPRWLAPTIAASLLLALLGAAFSAGTWWKTWSTSQHVNRLVEEATTAQMAEYDRSMNTKLASIASSLAAIRQQDVAADKDMQQRLETILGRLVDNQSNLRTELENLALAAESAITSTRRDLNQLNQFTRSLAGLSQ